MGGGGSFTASPLTNVFGSEGGGSGTEGRGRPTNLSAPTSRLADLGAVGRGRAPRDFDPPPGSLACSDSAAAPGTPGASSALFAHGSAPTGAGSALWTFSSLTPLPLLGMIPQPARRNARPRSFTTTSEYSGPP